MKSPHMWLLAFVALVIYMGNRSGGFAPPNQRRSIPDKSLTFFVTEYPGESLADLKGFVYVDPSINDKEFPPQPEEAARQVALTLWEGLHRDSDEVLAVRSTQAMERIEERGQRPATLRELIALIRENPHLPESLAVTLGPPFPPKFLLISAFGARYSSKPNCYVALAHDNNGNRLEKHCFDGFHGIGMHFLASPKMAVPRSSGQSKRRPGVSM